MWTCAYRNDTPRMVILRCLGTPCFFQEKVVFPFETWCFDCPADSEVQVWCHEPGGAELEAIHAAAALRVDGGGDRDAEPVALGFAGLVMAPESVHVSQPPLLGSNGLVAGPGACLAPVGKH